MRFVCKIWAKHVTHWYFFIFSLKNLLDNYFPSRGFHRHQESYWNIKIFQLYVKSMTRLVKKLVIILDTFNGWKLVWHASSSKSCFKLFEHKNIAKYWTFLRRFFIGTQSKNFWVYKIQIDDVTIMMHGFWIINKHLLITLISIISEWKFPYNITAKTPWVSNLHWFRGNFTIV